MSQPHDSDATTRGESISAMRFAKIRKIFEAALSRPAGDRADYVNRACGDDRKLLGEVQAMLSAEQQGGAILDSAKTAPPSRPSSAPEEGRFPAGTVLAGRYRILGLLGSGGMGEVYRAYDQILNQTVALKFLAPARIGEAALVRFRNEVRIARQVSHPNVCRVYDLGMVEGLHFLSMEYIDGEDLASLLRRIGRLPQDKAIEFTRKICAGLGAAHERGVLHRDLKPANIMIDGRGHVRITDFGLAGLAAEIPLSDLRSGTPAYMSPEQKAGREVTVRSDIYSLGLVLHEMFTGKQRTVTQSNPSDLVKDLDPAIERLILRCLEDEPKRRPNSALSVAMALPGADPVAAALAAGETPSPEMVAASQEKDGFSARTAVLCFAAVVLCFVFGLWASERFGFLAHTPLPLPPEALADRAQQLIRSLGYTDEPVDRAYGFDCCDPQVVDLLKNSDATRRNEIFASHRPPLMRFWYRQHRRPFDATKARFGIIDPGSPPMLDEGMILVEMDGAGNLVRLEVRPWWNAADQETAFDWRPLFSRAGLEMENFSPPTSCSIVPRMSTDECLAWTEKAETKDSERLRVEAASLKNRPVFFALAPQESKAGEFLSPLLTPLTNVVICLMITVMIAAAAIAWNNRRMGRGDRRGAMILAISAFLTLLSGLTLRSQAHSALNFTDRLEIGVFWGTVTWVFYTAVEPYVRRHWPDSLVSWARLADGRFRDSLVASHILAGIVVAAAVTACWQLLPLASLIQDVFWTTTAFSLDGSAFSLGVWIRTAGVGVFYSLFLLILIIILRLAVRRLLVADVLAAGLLALAGLSGFTVSGWGQTAGVTFYFTMTHMIYFWLLRRFGFLAMLVVWVVLFPATFLPLRATGWVAWRSLPLQLIPVALAAWALWVILSAERRHLTEPSGH